MADDSHRQEVLAILVDTGCRTADASRERIDSLELARLIYEVEQRYGLVLEWSDDDLAAMSTVSGAAEVLERLRGQGAAVERR